MNETDVIGRINLMLWLERVTREELSQRTGIAQTRWANTLQGKAKLRHEEIEALGKAWPEYMLWLAYGVETLDVDQISPTSKTADERRKEERFKKERRESLESFKRTGILSKREEMELKLLIETKFSWAEIEDAVDEMEYEDRRGMWPPASEKQDEEMKNGRKRHLEDVKKTKKLSDAEEEELKLLTENKFSYDEITGKIFEMKREARKIKYSCK